MAGVATQKRKQRAQLTQVFSADPVESAKAAHLRYVLDTKPGYTRKREADKFSYFDTKGNLIKDAMEIERINKIGIPPAYEDVWICPDANGHLQATGRDKRGRKQYRYHARWQSGRGETKFTQMVAFGALLPELRKKIESDMARHGMPREKVLAAVVFLLDRTHIRVGNEEYARDNQSYGLTTIHNEHVKVNGTKISFDFKGKSGKDWSVELKDRRLAKIISQCEALPGQELFCYVDAEGQTHDVTSDDVNAYLKELTGFDITAKYFRTWAGTLHAALALHDFEPVDTLTAAKRNLVQAVKEVAKHLGNTPAVCKKSYIHPHILESYLACKLHGCWCSALECAQEKPEDGLTCEESAVLAVLRDAMETIVA